MKWPFLGGNSGFAGIGTNRGNASSKSFHAPERLDTVRQSQLRSLQMVVMSSEDGSAAREPFAAELVAF